jgi:hydroxymethylglutaryl-CoA lyase
MINLPKAVRIVEVGPRDGLQNQSKTLKVEEKLEFIHLLARAGLHDVEASSFVHPQWVPQLADADELVPRLPQLPGVRYSALVPNMKGLERALKAGIGRIAVFTAASETFNKKNINMTIAESLAVIRPVVEASTKAGVSVRGYVSTCFCLSIRRESFEGEGDRSDARSLRPGCGRGFDWRHDWSSDSRRRGRHCGKSASTILRFPTCHALPRHLRDGGRQCLCVAASWNFCFDSSAGGIGGCPYAPGATGNVATERLHYLFERLGIEDGVSGDRLKEAVHYITDRLRAA